jgi:hypothetical protein
MREKTVRLVIKTLEKLSPFRWPILDHEFDTTLSTYFGKKHNVGQKIFGQKGYCNLYNNLAEEQHDTIGNY